MTTRIDLVLLTKWKMWWAKPSMNLIRLSLTLQQHLIWHPWWAVIMESTDRCLDQWAPRLKWEMGITATIAKTVLTTTLGPSLNRQISWTSYKRQRWQWKQDQIFYPRLNLLEELKVSQWKDLSRTNMSRSCKVKQAAFLKNHLQTKSWWALHHLTRINNHRYPPSTQPQDCPLVSFLSRDQIVVKVALNLRKWSLLRNHKILLPKRKNLYLKKTNSSTQKWWRKEG